MIAKETIDGLITEANWNLGGNKAEYIHNGMNLIEPKFLLKLLYWFQFYEKGVDRWIDNFIELQKQNAELIREREMLQHQLSIFTDELNK